MVYANRPRSLFPSFKTTIATAFATGEYGVVFSCLWRLGNIFELWRLILLMVAAMAILIGWIIISHRLWQSHRSASLRYLTSLCNTASRSSSEPCATNSTPIAVNEPTTMAFRP